MTHLEDLHALLSERAHLRAQRDELQRDCTRFEAEARAAREEVRRLRAMRTPAAIPPPSEQGDIAEHQVSWAKALCGWALPGKNGWPIGFIRRHPDGVYVGTCYDGISVAGTVRDPSLWGCERKLSLLLRDMGRLDGLTVDRSILGEPEQPAAIPSQPKCEDIDEPKTIADLLALGRPVIGLRVAVPFSVPPIPATVTSIDTYKDGDTCTILRDDGLSVSYWPRDVYFVKPAPEEKPAYVARWERSGHKWVLVNGMLIVARLEQNGTTDEFEAVVDSVIVDRHTKIKAAATAEWHAQNAGLIPIGPIDRSALNELRREVDPGTHNAARMAARPYLSTALRRRGNAARDGIRRRRLRGQWWGHQPDRHWRHSRAMRR